MQQMHVVWCAADQQELRDAADELMRSANDPKFKNSKFMNFVKKIGAGEVTFEGNKLVENGNGTAASQRTHFEPICSIEHSVLFAMAAGKMQSLG